jgi:isopentenyldiphosphate isomerase
LFFSVFGSVCIYNTERENPFEGRLLVCKRAKKVIVFPSEWEVWQRFLQGVVSFPSVKNLFLKVSSFKVKVF